MSSTAYSYDDDEDYVPTKKVKYSEREDILPLIEKKHTLDSDEEDNDIDIACVSEDDDDAGASGTGDRRYDILKDDDIDGQEEGTIDFEGETKITPFNMKEEMEEGHFDGDGFYHFKKDDNIRDAWLDDIDWVKIKHVEENANKYGSDIESDDEEDNTSGITSKESSRIIKIYAEIFHFLKPTETVAKALKRLGGNKKMTSAQRWKIKKLATTEDSSSDDSMENFLKLTGFANQIIESGNMDVYQETYEMINLKIERSKAPAPAPTLASDPSLDMFAGGENGKVTTESTESSEKDNKSDDAPDSFAEVKWRFKWKNEDEEEIHGPFKSQEMLKWQESGYFKTGVYVQKTNETSGSWYSSKRIDFDLYT